ncbi:hypothetical protein LHFGNBLO_002219 [Mesorhizobium sp. AR10]|uniref:hypothetical protein n=1 Tax=Mesorhizobium sp. AR10 TaxID=2865839 RepID=UPI00216003E6|nr:hypothetical protein [Mesorhizobium sp. AR10]UVK40712.1 hypothetical protein LHFGNBLO_002219 [Mesorhizobium sp. AR10]
MRNFFIEAALAAILLSTAGAAAAGSLPPQAQQKFDLVVRKETRNHASLPRHLQAPAARSTAPPPAQLKSDSDKYPSVDGLFSGMDGF